jgi:proteasome accessory factor C
MSNNAKEQVARLLALVPLIRRQGAMHVDQAAAALGVTPTQLVKDLKVLIFCGWPGWLPGDLIEVDLDAFEEGGDGIIRISNADYLAEPLRLSSAEASAVIVALRTLQETADDSVRASVNSALKKLEDAAAEGGVADVRVSEQELAVADIRSRLTAAIEAGRQIRLTYFVPARDENTERVVDPFAVVSHHASSYLDAWCHRAGQRRSFRLDRIVTAEVLDTPAEEHPDVTPLDPATGVYKPAPEHTQVTLRLAPQSRWVAEYYPVEASRELGGGAIEVELHVADERWLVRLLLRLAPYAEVVAPESAAESFAAAARDALRLYEPAD